MKLHVPCQGLSPSILRPGSQSRPSLCQQESYLRQALIWIWQLKSTKVFHSSSTVFIINISKKYDVPIPVLNERCERCFSFSFFYLPGTGLGAFIGRLSKPPPLQLSRESLLCRSRSEKCCREREKWAHNYFTKCIYVLTALTKTHMYLII